MSLEDIVEFANNPEPRCPVVLLLDTSASMSGNRIRQLNSGVITFKDEVIKDDVASLRVEIAIVTFNSSVQVEQEFITICDFSPPQFGASGSTSMGEGILKTIDLVESRKATYKEHGVPYYQPWVFLITDGSPTDDWENAAHQVKESVATRKLSFFIVGVQDADINLLRKIASPKISPVMLDGLKFQEMFRWLSASVKRVSTNKVGEEQIDLPSITGWARVDT